MDGGRWGIPLLHQPGEAWLYDTCSDLQGVLTERIFEPLGMVARTGSGAACPFPAGSGMQWITIVTPPFTSIETFDATLAQLGGDPEGLEERHVGTAADATLRVVSLWESKARADEFFDSGRLGSALANVLGPEPAGAVDIARSYVREPVT